MHVPVTVTDNSLSSFYKGLYAVVDDPSLDSVVSWSKDKKSFVIWDPIEFQRRVLPTTGRQRRILSLNFSIFMVDLKYYGFIRVKGSKHRYHIGHPRYFVRGKPELMKKMQEERIHKFEQARAMRKKAKARAMELADSLGDLAL